LNPVRGGRETPGVLRSLFAASGERQFLLVVYAVEERIWGIAIDNSANVAALH
jgi:hypothetical protein